MTVTIRPMPESFKKFSMKYRPSPPPVFPDGDPTAKDRKLAKSLFKVLDADSKNWYRRNNPGLFK